MFQWGKMDNIVAEMERLQIHILEVSDLSWPRNRECATNNEIMYYSGRADELEHK